MKALILLMFLGVSGAQEEVKSCCSASAEVSDDLPENSLYQVEIDLKGQDGQVSSLSEFRGQPIVISMFFTSCISVCPQTAKDMLALESLALEAGAKDYSLVLVSMDVKNDKPKALKAFAERNHLQNSRIRLFTAKTPSDAKALSQILALPYRLQKDGSYGHASGLILMDKDGVFVMKEPRLAADQGPMAKRIAELTGVQSDS